jgi:hypothetical protein
MLGCATLHEPRVLTIPDERVRPVRWLEWIVDYPDALASIAAIMERELELPPLQAAFIFFRNREALEGGLLAVGYDPVFARETANAMVAIGGYRAVLLNAAAFDRAPWPERVNMLAHELTHTIQYELGGGHRGTSEQWIREGFADWVAELVLEAMGASLPGRGRYELLRQVRAVRDPARLPRLEEMVTFRQWVGLRVNSPQTPTYPLAFVATDFLIQRHGVAALLDYFRLFAMSQDRLLNFRTAFGEELREFAQAFEEYLAGLF